MSGTDKRGEGDRGHQADWIEDEGEMQVKAPLASPLGAYRSPLDDEVAAPVEAGDLSPPPFEPEGPGTMGDAPHAAVIQELNELMLSALVASETVVMTDLGKKIDKASVEMMEQIAAHTAAVNRLSAGAGSEAQAKELRAFAEKST